MIPPNNNQGSSIHNNHNPISTPPITSIGMNAPILSRMIPTINRIPIINPPIPELYWELLRRPPPELELFRLLPPNVLVFRVIQPLMLFVVVCRSEPSLFHEEDCVRLIPPEPDLVEWVIRVPLPARCVVVVRVVDPVFFDVRLYAMINCMIG